MIYLDSAATTYQKPPAVFRAVRGAMASMTSPGRGTYGPAARASRTLLACREEAAALFQVGQPERVVLTFNATHGLNIAVHSLVKPGATVLLSGYEHNAVTRPLAAIADVRLRVVRAPLFCPNLFLEELERRLTPEVDVVICTHVSNVFGYVLPVEEVAALCRRRQVPLIVDASQSAGVLPVRMEDWGAAFVAMPGHKGLYGPQGTGLLLCQAGGEPLIAGGTGSLSEELRQPDFLPDRLESGTLNIIGAASLKAGIEFVQRQPMERLLQKESRLCTVFCSLLESDPAIQLYREPGVSYVPIVSFNAVDIPPEELAAALGEQGFCLRAGLHCSPLAHQTLGTPDGTVRFAPSAFSRESDVIRLADAVKKSVRMLKK